MLNNNNYFGNNQYLQGYAQQPFYSVQRLNNVSYASEEEVRGYFLSPNSQVFALDKEKPIFYIKTADNLGRSTLIKYRFEEFVEEEKPKPEYLTKVDIEGLTNDIEALKTQFKNFEEHLKPKAIIGGGNERII